MWNVLYNLIVMPIQLIVEITYTLMNRFLGNKGLAIIAVSLVIQTLVLPLYKRSDKLQEEERKKQESMSHWVNHIKKTFNGDERYMMLSTYYRQQNYKTYYSLKSSFSILLQIPFFLAAYNFLSKLQELNGVSFLFISDLGQPDRLFSINGFAINVLPIMMTLFNIISGIIYTKGMPFRAKMQVYGLAAVFLVLLYTSPSGLVLYWTMNNLYSLLKNVFMKILKHPGKVFGRTMLVAGVAMFMYLRNCGELSKVKLCLVVMFVIICQIPYLEEKRREKGKDGFKKIAEQIASWEIRSGLVIWEELFLAVLLGLLIPLSVIYVSPTEFVVDGANPMTIVYNCLSIYVGIFLVWFSVFYILMTENARKLFALLLMGCSAMAIFNYMVYNNRLGVMSPMLVYEVAPSFSSIKKIVNLIIIFLFFALFLYFTIKKSKVCKSVLQITVICMIILCGLKVKKINEDVTVFRETKEDFTTDGLFALSKEGKNVVIIMLDRAINAYVPFILEENEDVKEAFSDFTYYPNTLSFGAFTNLTTASLFGGYEYSPKEINLRKDETLEEKQNEALSVLPVLFWENGYDVTVCDPPYAGYCWIPDISIYDEYDGIDAYITEGAYKYKKEEFLNISNKDIQRSNFVYYSLTKVMPIIMQNKLYNGGHYCTTKYGDTNYLISDLFINTYTTMISMKEMTYIVDGPQNTFLMFQNNVTHAPTIMKTPEYIPSNSVNVEEEMLKQPEYVIDGHRMLTDTEDMLAHYQTNVATYKAIAEWLRFLKENDVYDNTRIIIVSDHGRDLEQFDYMLLDNGIDLEYYNPLLLIKDFDSKGFVTSNEFMTNADVPTYAVDGLIEDPHNPFTGKKLDNTEKYAHPQYVTTSHNWHIEETNGYTLDVDDGEWYEVEKDIFDVNNWKKID